MNAKEATIKSIQELLLDELDPANLDCVNQMLVVLDSVDIYEEGAVTTTVYGGVRVDWMFEKGSVAAVCDPHKEYLYVRSRGSSQLKDLDSGNLSVSLYVARGGPHPDAPKPPAP